VNPYKKTGTMASLQTLGIFISILNWVSAPLLWWLLYKQTYKHIYPSPTKYTNTRRI